MRSILLLVAALCFPVSGWAQDAPPPRADLKATIDHLLDALKVAPTEETAAPLELQITELWLRQGSPAVSLLMARGLRELKAHTPQDAEEDLSADLQQALDREPRDFGAFRMLEQIAEAREDWKSAYAAQQQLMAIDPKTPGGADKLKDLRRRALGQET
jgi:hypothetical protein